MKKRRRRFYTLESVKSLFTVPYYSTKKTKNYNDQNTNGHKQVRDMYPEGIGFKQWKHTRDVDKKDKFFVVSVMTSEVGEMEIGWIEKEFIESDFLDGMPKQIKDFNIVEIKSIVTFTDRNKYENYKHNR